MSEVTVKKNALYPLELTVPELIHLRDLMTVILPGSFKSVSATLAEGEGRIVTENLLWDKVYELCEDLELPVGAEAPDYVIAPTEAPVLGVIQVNSKHTIVESTDELESEEEVTDSDEDDIEITEEAE